VLSSIFSPKHQMKATLATGEKEKNIVFSGNVREHPEELRPISKKLLRQAQQDATDSLKKNQKPFSRRRVGRPRSVRS
jgi:hypothetical protein